MTGTDNTRKPTHRCPKCGHTAYFEITSGKQFLAGEPIIGCPGCGTVMEKARRLRAVSRG